MLSDQQKLTVKVAVGRAVDKDAEISKLAKGFAIPEKEVRSYWNELSGNAPAQKPEAVAAEHKRTVWTGAMLQQLEQLHNEGKGPAEIAKIMGLYPIQVGNKLRQISGKTHSQALQHGSEEAGGDVPPVPKGEAIPVSSTFDMTGCLLDFTRYLRSEFQASIVFIQSRPLAGWSTVRFQIGNQNYCVSLRKAKERKHRA